MKFMTETRATFVIAIYVVCILSFVPVNLAQNGSQPVTDPYEAAALNSVFREWKISGTDQGWNVSGEICSGSATDSTNFDTTTKNPFITCDCSYDSNTTCHITRLKVYALDVVGVIPEELWNLTYLTNLNLGQNYLTGSLSSSIANLTRMQYLNLGINALSGELPQQLGLLTNLVVLYFDSSGVSDEIPLTFANLQSMQQMDLSFYNITGQIPESLFNISTLSYLFMGNNKLTGTLPSQNQVHRVLGRYGASFCASATLHPFSSKEAFY